MKVHAGLKQRESMIQARQPLCNGQCYVIIGCVAGGMLCGLQRDYGVISCMMVWLSGGWWDVMWAME